LVQGLLIHQGNRSGYRYLLDLGVAEGEKLTEPQNDGGVKRAGLLTDVCNSGSG